MSFLYQISKQLKIYEVLRVAGIKKNEPVLRAIGMIADFFSKPEEIKDKAQNDIEVSEKSLNKRKQDTKTKLDEFGELKSDLYKGCIRDFLSKVKDRDIPQEVKGLKYLIKSANITELKEFKSNENYLNLSKTLDIAFDAMPSFMKLFSGKKLDSADKWNLAFGAMEAGIDLISARYKKLAEAEKFAEEVKQKILDNNQEISELNNLCETVDFLRNKMKFHAEKLNDCLKNYSSSKDYQSMVTHGVSLCKCWLQKLYDQNLKVISVEELKK